MPEEEGGGMVAAAATLLLGGRLVHQEAKHGSLAPLFLFLVPFLCSTLRPLPSSRPGVGGVIPFAVSTEQLSGTALLLRFFVYLHLIVVVIMIVRCYFFFAASRG